MAVAFTYAIHFVADMDRAVAFYRSSRRPALQRERVTEMPS